MLEQGEVGETQRVLGAPARDQQVGDEEDCRGQQPPQVDGSQEGHGAGLVGMAGRGTVCRASRRAEALGDDELGDVRDRVAVVRTQGGSRLTRAARRREQKRLFTAAASAWALAHLLRQWMWRVRAVLRIGHRDQSYGGQVQFQGIHDFYGNGLTVGAHPAQRGLPVGDPAGRGVQEIGDDHPQPVAAAGARQVCERVRQAEGRLPRTERRSLFELAERARHDLVDRHAGPGLPPRDPSPAQQVDAALVADPPGEQGDRGQGTDGDVAFPGLRGAEVHAG